MSNFKKTINGAGKSALPLIVAGAGLILIAVAMVFFSSGAAFQPKVSADRVEVPGSLNYSAPEIELTDLNGEAVSLSGLSGQVVLVNNWATWCPPCRAEMPALEAYYRAHKNDGFTLIGINSGDRHEQVADFKQEYSLTFPLWLDPTGSALRAFQNNALPSSYVIDKSGVVRFVWMGAIDQDVLETYVTPLLASE